MKVLRTVATFYPHVTGPAYQAYKVSEGLEQRGHESPIVTTNVVPKEEEPGYPPEMDPGDSFPFDITRRKPIFSVDQYRMPPQALYDYFSESLDIVHCHGYQNAIKDVFYLGNLVDSKPFVIHGHGSFSKKNDPTLKRSLQFKLYDKLWFRTIERADAIVVSSAQERNDAISFGVNEEKIWTIPVGKEKSVYNSVPRNPPEHHLRLLFVGRLAPRRNVELLIETIAELDYSDIELRIVGGEGTLSDASEDEYLVNLRNRVSDLQIENQVTFTGPKYGTDLIQEYRNSHIFVNPTHYENFGQANLEAAFAGLPLIATPTGIALDLVDEEKTGFLFNSKSELIDIIHKIYTNEAKIHEMSEKISASAEKEYTWEGIIDKYCNMYASIV